MIGQDAHVLTPCHEVRVAREKFNRMVTGVPIGRVDKVQA